MPAVKTLDVANFRHQSRAVNGADARNADQDILKGGQVGFNRFIEGLDLILNGANPDKADGEELVQRVVYSSGNTVGASGGGLQSFRHGLRIGELAFAAAVDEIG